MARRSVTLKDVAKKTGYSINTVSHALRDKNDVLPETKKFILQVANEMGYVENTIAQSMRLGYTKTIAVILGDVSNPHFAILMKEIELEAFKMGYNVFLMSTDEDESKEYEAIKTAIHRSVDGIIICPVQKTENNVLFLASTGVPFVLIGRYFSTLCTNYCVCDDVQGGYQATKYLIEHGHKNILMLCGPQWISSAKERLEGYKKALEESDIKFDSSLVKEISVISSDCSDIIDSIPRSSYSAVFCFSDIVAWSAMNYFEKNGVRVPEDVSIIGFDHIQSRLTLPFSLTSISSYKGRMSKEAFDILYREMNGGVCCEKIVIETNIAEGKTVSYLK